MAEWSLIGPCSTSTDGWQDQHAFIGWGQRSVWTQTVHWFNWFRHISFSSQQKASDKASSINDCLWLHRISNQTPIYGRVKWWQTSGRIWKDFQSNRLYLQKDAVMTIMQLLYPLWYCSHSCSPVATVFPLHLARSLIWGLNLHKSPSGNRYQKSNGTEEDYKATSTSLCLSAVAFSISNRDSRFCSMLPLNTLPLWSMGCELQKLINFAIVH